MTIKEIFKAQSWLRLGLQFMAASLIVSALILPQAAPAQAANPIPTFKISAVECDKTVNIQTANFPAHKDFKVRMGAYGTLGIGGIVVGTTNSGSGGTIKLTYAIPASLKGSYRIAIRLDGEGGYYSYNWFYNKTTSGIPVVPVYQGIPTFTILSVVKDQKVTIRTKNFPTNKDFIVRMGAYGTMGIGGTVVATTNSGSGGVFEATYNIPAKLKGSYRVAIRMDSTSGGFYSFNWFYNNTTK